MKFTKIAIISGDPVLFESVSKHFFSAEGGLKYLPWLVKLAQEETIGAMCCIDSPNPKAIEAAMALAKGLYWVIIDPTDRLMQSVYSAQALSGKDDFCMKYIKAFSAGKLS